MGELKNGTKRARGGKRANAGRKPSAKTVLARLALAELDEEAEKSVQFMVHVRDNPKVSWGIRVEAAKDLIDRRFGKAKQAHELTGKNGGPIKTKNVPDMSKLSEALLKKLAEGSDASK